MTNHNNTGSQRARYLTALPKGDGSPVIAVDLGYSKHNKTCGIAITGDPEGRALAFGAAVQEASRLLTLSPEAVVVLEAVLSTLHASEGPDKGNPQERGLFEKGRGWYQGPGAVTALAAWQFLAELDKHLPEDQSVYLAEAFLSNKPEGKSDHAKEALLIANGFWKIETAAVHKGVVPLLPIISGVSSIRVFTLPGSDPEQV